MKSARKRVAKVGILMGSESDWPTMKAAYDICLAHGVGCEVDVVSAHRTPLRMSAYARDARERGLRVLVAGAGGAAHLPGMIASNTTLPVVGVPVESKYLRGLDSLLSIVQMPGGVPVATMAIGGAKNAGLLALQILALSDAALHQKLLRSRRRQEQESTVSSDRLRTELGLPLSGTRPSGLLR